MNITSFLRSLFRSATWAAALAGLSATLASAQVADDATGVAVGWRFSNVNYSSSSGYFYAALVDVAGNWPLPYAFAPTTDTTQAICRLAVGHTYEVEFLAEDVTSFSMFVMPPPGYIVEIEKVARERYDSNGVPATLRVRIRPPAATAPSRAGVATALGTERTLWQASLGSLSNGESAGALGFIDADPLASSDPAASIFTPEGLTYDAPSSEVQVLINGSGVQSPFVPGTIRQIIAPQVCVNVHMTTSYQCQVQFYHRQQLGQYSNGIYSFTGDPFAWYFFNQDGVDPNAVRISCDLRNTTGIDGNGVPYVLGPLQPVVRTKVTTLQRTGTTPNFTWTAKDWYDNGGSSLVQETRSRNGTTETLTTAVPGQSSDVTVVRTYASIAGGQDVATVRLGAETPPPGGSPPIVTTYAYWDSPTVTSESASYARAKSSIAHGLWEAYEYYDYADGITQAGALRRRHRPFNNSNTSVPDLASHLGEITTFGWGLDPFGRATRLTSMETTIGGVTSARTTVSYSSPAAVFSGHASTTVVAATRNDYCRAGVYLTSVIKFFSEDAGVAQATDDFFRNRIHSVQRPDGVKQSFVYQHGTWNGSSFVLSTNGGVDPVAGSFASRISVITGSTSVGNYYSSHDGYPIDPLYLVVDTSDPNHSKYKSTMEVTIRDNYARVVRTEKHVRTTGGWQLIGAVNYQWNYSNQLLKRASNDQTGYDLTSGAVYVAEYNHENLTSEANESGINLTYTYDASGRVDIATKSAGGSTGALATKFSYNAAGRVIERRDGWGQSEQLISAHSIDDGGRLISRSEPGPNGALVTTYVYDPANRRVTISAPGGRQRIETYLADGALSQVTGSGVVPEYYTRSPDTGGNLWMRVNLGTAPVQTTDGSAWDTTSLRQSKEKTDWLGRTIRAEQPGFLGQPDFVAEAFYEVTGGPDIGHVRKIARTANGSAVLAPARYEYDALGQVSNSGLDIGDNGLVADSTDRINNTETFVENTAGAWWLTTVQKTYPTANNSAALTVSVTRRRLTNFTATLPEFGGSLLSEIQRADVDGNTTTVKTFVDRGVKTTKVATTTSGLTNQEIKTYTNGLPTSITRFDGLVYSTGYDSLHRRSTSSDPRTGASTTYYKSGSVFVWKTYDAANFKTAEYEYDAAGRVKSIIDANNKVARIDYNKRDQVIRRWGQATYPVEYAYNTFGERTALRTFRAGDFTGTNWPLSDSGIDSTGTPDPSYWTSGDKTTWVYDSPSGLLSSKTDANDKTVSYTYNARGQTATRTWARGVVATYGYDSNTGELTGVTYSDNTPLVSYVYTRAGQLYTVADSTGTRTFRYGTAPASHALQLDRVDLPAYFNSRQLARQYDSIHRPSGFALGSEVSQTYWYHGTTGRFDHLDTTSNAQTSRTFAYGYNTGGLISTLTSGSLSVSYGYEPNRDLLTSIDSQWSSVSRTRYDYTYNALAQRETAKQFGNTEGGAFTDFGGSTYYRYVYNDRGEVTEAVNYFGEDATSTTSPQLTGRRFGYAYDSIGNRASGTRALGTSVNDVFTPNALNQYAQRENDVTYAAGTAQTSSSIAVTGGTTTASVGRAGRYWGAETTLNNNSNPVATNLTITATLAGVVRTEQRTAFLAKALQFFTYDFDGNLTGDGVWNYTYDAENRLTVMETDPNAIPYLGSANARRLEFQYDYLNRRVQKLVRGGWNGSSYTSITKQRRYLYDGDNLAAELTGDGTGILCSFTWGLDLVGSLTATGGIGALVQITDHNTSTSYFPTYDGNGNIISLLRPSDGVVMAKYEYSPFGELLRCEGAYAKENPFRFSTKFTDDESGLVYYGARFYSPGMGRFLNRDPIEETAGLNLYGFCGNDAINGYDVLGYSFWSSIKKAFHQVANFFYTAAKNAVVNTISAVAGTVAAVGSFFVFGPESVPYAFSAGYYGAQHAAHRLVFGGGYAGGGGGTGPPGTRSPLVMNFTAPVDSDDPALWDIWASDVINGRVEPDLEDLAVLRDIVGPLIAERTARRQAQGVREVIAIAGDVAKLHPLGATVIGIGEGIIGEDLRGNEISGIDRASRFGGPLISRLHGWLGLGVRAGKAVIQQKGKWKPGDDPHAPTRNGNPPSDQTVRRREWKNEAENPTRDDFTPEHMDRMKQGKPPQRYNPEKPGIESMERSHEKVPKREGGTQTVPRWPPEHAAVDPNRRLGYPWDQ